MEAGEKKRLTRVKIGRRMLSELITWKSTDISKLASQYQLRPSTVLQLMCEAMEEDEKQLKGKKR